MHGRVSPAQPSEIAYRPDIDGLRTIAVGTVILFHGKLGLLPGGFVGVDVFFVISGFIIATTTRGQAGVEAAGAFLWRRFRRVAPIYWLLSLPILIGMARGGTLSPEVASATFLFWPFSGLEMTFPALGPGWTLCFEMLFYAGFGLAMAGGRRVGWGLIGAYAAMLAAGLVLAAPVLRFWGAPIILEFLLGVGIASVWRFAPRGLALWAVGLAVAVPARALFPDQAGPGVLAAVAVGAGCFGGSLRRGYLWNR